MPIWTSIVLISFLAFWFAVFVFMITRGDARKDSNLHAEFKDRFLHEFEHVAHQGTAKIRTTKSNGGISFLLCFGIPSSFLLLDKSFPLAQSPNGKCCKKKLRSVSSYRYFTRDKSELSWTVTSSAKRTFRYHLGSAAFGSLIIAIVQVIT